MNVGDFVMLNNGVTVVIDEVDDYDLETNEGAYFGSDQDGKEYFFTDDGVMEYYGESL